MDLLFQSPVFNKGPNITCRRGIKWDIGDKKNIKIKETGKRETLHIVDIHTRVFKFSDLKDEDVFFEHEPDCRTVAGLLLAMKATYPGFDEREIVTLVEFYL